MSILAALQVATRGARQSGASVPATLYARRAYSSSTLGVEVFNPSGQKRVVVTKMLPGTRWLDILTKKLGARVEVLTDERFAPTIVPNSAIVDLIGEKCDGVLGQLTEDWSAETFNALKSAGGVVYSNYAVGYNNVNVDDNANDSDSDMIVTVIVVVIVMAVLLVMVIALYRGKTRRRQGL